MELYESDVSSRKEEEIGAMFFRSHIYMKFTTAHGSRETSTFKPCVRSCTQMIQKEERSFQGNNYTNWEYVVFDVWRYTLKIPCCSSLSSVSLC